MQIPFNRPYLTENEIRYMEDVLHSLSEGGHVSGDGKMFEFLMDGCIE